LESEVDTLKEDTQSKNLESEDNDDTQYTTLLDIDKDKDSAIELGIDVSKWNGDIDWDVVKEEGVDFAIIRCGYRGSSSGWLIEDPYFYKNIQGAKKAGIKVGIYFFTQATDQVEAVEEASAAVALLGDIDLDYPVFIDTEGAGGNGRADNIDVNTRTAVVNAFCKTIQDSGLEAGVYASRNWYYNNLNTSELDGYNIWLAEYRQSPEYTGKYDMWQYTSSGTVSGIEGRVDLDISYK
jgi:GH25 family lysozyme M1 (1,4-beta-N-acetylmuramidase)